MKKNPKRNSTPSHQETNPAVANPANESTPAAGTSNESLQVNLVITPSPPETTNSSESLPADQLFIGLVEAGLTSWIKAGELLVEMVKADGDKAFQTILKQCPWMNEPMLWNFYRIGQHQLYPKTLIFASNQFVAREIASLPWSVQAEVCEKGLPLLNGTRLERKPVNQLDRRDVDLGITDGKLNSLSQQLTLSKQIRSSSTSRATKPAKVNSNFAPELDMPPDKPAATNLISTGFYRVDFKFGTMTLVRLPKPKMEIQTIVLHPALGNYYAFVEILRQPASDQE